MAEHGKEGLSDDESEELVDAHGDALPGRPRHQREGLALDQPPQRAPRPGEGRHEAAHQNHHQDGEPLLELLRLVLHFHPEDDGDHHLGEEHLDSGLQEKNPPPQFVDGVDGNDGAENVDGAGDDGGVERGVAAKAEGVEEDRGVEHDGVDAGELLEDLEGDGYDELGAVTAEEEEGGEGVLDLVGQVASLNQFSELRLDLVCATDSPDHRFPFFQPPPLGQAILDCPPPTGPLTSEAPLEFPRGPVISSIPIRLLFCVHYSHTNKQTVRKKVVLIKPTSVNHRTVIKPTSQ